MSSSGFDIIDISVAQPLMNSLAALTGVAVGILDPCGNLLISTGFLEICAGFHRTHPEAARRCRQNETFIQSVSLQEAPPSAFGYSEHTCPNGLVNAALPIRQQGRLLGTFFIGQFFHEPPDKTLFLRQARQFGFDSAPYIKALEKVPVLKRQRIDDIVTHGAHLVTQLFRLAAKRYRLLDSQNELQEAHRRLENIIEFLPDATFVIDRDKKLVAWNRAIEQMTQVRKEEILGQSDYAYALPFYGVRRPILADLVGQPQSEISEKYDFVRHRGDTLVAETFIPSLNNRQGAYLWGIAAPLMDQNGRQIGIIESIRDITDRKKAEIELLQSEQKFRSLFEEAAAGIFLMTPQGRLLQVNPSFCRYLDYSENELLQLSVHDITAPADRAVTEGKYVEFASGNRQTLHYDKRYRRKDGKVVWGRASVSCVHFPNGAPNYCIGLVQDITEQKRSELHLQASEKKYKRLSREFEALLDGIQDCLLLLSPEMKIIWANRKTATLFERDTLSGVHCFSLHNRTDPCTDCPVTRAFSTGQVENQQLEKPGGQIWAIKAYPIKNKEDQVINILMLASDITEKKLLREQAQRASHLASLGQLAAGVAHEINNPNALSLLNGNILNKLAPGILAALDGHARRTGDFSLAENMLFSEIRDEIPQLISGIVDSANRIKRIVEDTKDFARPLPPKTEPVDLNSTVQAAVRLTNRTIQAATRQLRTDYAQNLPMLHGNAQQIEQVAVNLISNACMALEHRDQRLTLRTYEHAIESTVILEVTDEGAGIAPEVLDKVTEPFFTTCRKSGGTGLGLYVVARIMRDHHGTLQITSQPGTGTTVLAAFPRD